MTDKPEDEEDFTYSLNQEDYSFAYGDREQALFEATQAVNDDTGDDDRCLHKPGELVTVYTARCVKRQPGYYPTIEDLLERVREAAYEDVGEHAENWLGSVTNVQKNELDTALCNVFDAWCKKHKHYPVDRK